MQIFDYFEPVDFSQFSELENSTGKYSLGRSIQNFTEKLSVAAIAKAGIVIFGVPFDNNEANSGAALAPGRIRKELYRLATLNNRLNIVDLGNLKPASSHKGTFLALRDVTEYLYELGVVTVVIGGSQDLTVGICDAFRNNRYFSLSCIDAILDTKKGVETFNSGNYLTRIFKQLPQLFQFSLIGYQNHLVGEKLLSKTQGVSDHVRLGKLRDDFSIAEPLMRNTDVLSFDIGAVKYSEAATWRQKNPNGLRGEEACKLAHYAGISDRLKIFGIFEVFPENEENTIIYKLSAEIIWYFLEGCQSRKADDKIASENTITYKVEIDELEQPIIFLNDPDTNRWWYEITSLSGDNAVFACDEEDYRLAASNEIPGKWLDYIQKMDRLSK
jgi:arginase family enzyme